MKKGLVIVQVDGLSFKMMQKGLQKGFFPHLSEFMREKDYRLMRYRCGIPSTTPFCQAGIMYGEGDNIPAFRWWDKREQLLVTFGSQTTFQRVAHKYFKKHKPLLQGGACFAACFSGGAVESFTLVHTQGFERLGQIPKKLLAKLLSNPLHIFHWIITSAYFLYLSLKEMVLADLKYTHVAIKYVFYDMFNEIFIHHLTRFAVRCAMEEGKPVIYAGFYAYDNAAHAFGPEHPFSYAMLSHIDKTIGYLLKHAAHSARTYEFVFLSDHGNIKTVPIKHLSKEQFSDKIARSIPDVTVGEVAGLNVTPSARKIGDMLLVNSGQIMHIYINNSKTRISYESLRHRYPALLKLLDNSPETCCVLMKSEKGDMLIGGGENMLINNGRLSQKTKKFLAQFDDPSILAKQLHRFNSCTTAGDIILFGAFRHGAQITFEHQEGSHSAFGGEQSFPFLLMKKDWNIRTDDIIFSEQLYPKFVALKKQLGIK